jgi:hypothetical protein
MDVLNRDGRRCAVRSRAWFAWISAAFAVSCVPSLEGRLSTVSSPRLLAVRVTPAEAAPGAQVTLEALVAAPPGASDAALPRWWRCDARRALSDSSSVSPQCSGALDASALVPLGEGSSVTMTIAQDACAVFGPDPPAPAPGEPAGRPVDPDPTGGYFVPVRVSIGAAPDAFAEVRVRCPLAGAPPSAVVAFNRSDRGNENTELSAIEAAIDGGPSRLVGDQIELRASASVKLSLRWPACAQGAACGDGVCDPDDDARTCVEDCSPVARCRGAERYVYFDRVSRSVVTRVEAMRASFYSTAGSFRFERVGRGEAERETFVENEWTAPSAPGAYVLWFVLRDARGGVSWRSLAARVTP